MSEKKVLNIQLIREVVDAAYDGTSVKRTESVTAQIIWDTSDGMPPIVPDHSLAGDWRILD